MFKVGDIVRANDLPRKYEVVKIKRNGYVTIRRANPDEWQWEGTWKVKTDILKAISPLEQALK